MSNLSVFNFESHEIRFVGTADSPWWVAVDICKVLDITNATDAMTKLDPDEYTLVSTEGIGKGKAVNCVNESGLYSLVLTSRKPQAKRFKKWLTSEVIPAIRKTGNYSTNSMPSLPTDKSLAIATMRKERETLEAKVKQLDSEVADSRRKLAEMVHQEALLANTYIEQNKAIADEVARCEAIVKQAKALNPFLSVVK